MSAVTAVSPGVTICGALERIPEGVATVIYLRPEDEAGVELAARAGQCKERDVAFVHVPFDAGKADSVLAESVVSALEGAARPVLIECKSGKRAGAAASLAGGKGKEWEHVEKEARDLGLLWVGSDPLAKWVKENL